MAIPCFSFFFFLSCILPSVAGSSHTPSKLNIGINYGRIADNLPLPSQSISLIQALKIGKVKLYDSDPSVLQALANTGLEVVIGLPNQAIPTIALHNASAEEWVQGNVIPYLPSTHITTIAVGNELLTDSTNQQIWPQLVPAMANIYASLRRHNLSTSIKVTTSVALNSLNISYPPSAATFQESIATTVLQPMLRFLSHTNSYFFLNVYPYFAWASDPAQVPLDYALFGADAGVEDGGLHYTNLLDAQLDAVVAAMAKLGYPGVKLAISETGWPSYGDAGEAGANVANAACYNRRVVRKTLAYPPMGTPRRPGVFIPTYLFSLFNEDEKPGPSTERNWGILYPNGTSVYAIDLTGRLTDADYARHAPLHHRPLRREEGYHVLRGSDGGSGAEREWCVADPRADDSSVQKGLDYACGQGREVCMAVQEGQPCFHPNTLLSHASYAFNSYWQRMKHSGGTCDFAGAAILSRHDPSEAMCSYAYNP